MSTLKTLTIVVASVAGGTSLALSADAALAQAPAWRVYPAYGFAPYGYGYVPSGPFYNYAAPAYGYATPPYGPAGGQPPAAGNPAAESIATQTARHRGSIYMSAGGGSMHKKGTLKTAPATGGY